MKILILADIPGWIVDRITSRMMSGMPEVEWRSGYYASLTTEQIVGRAHGCHLIHYQNWDIARHWPHILHAGLPVLMSVRSHRYPPYVQDVARQVHVHVINPDLLEEFPGSHYIPDGIFDEHFSRPFVVGWAGQPSDYKGVHLIEQACRELGVAFRPALGGVPVERMGEYFDAIDLYVCGSLAEGYSAPVMECLARSKPVVTTSVGVPRHIPGICKVERTVEGIRRGILNFYTRPRVAEYTWQNVCSRFLDLYGRLSGAQAFDAPM